jgi:hypothetical protein
MENEMTERNTSVKKIIVAVHGIGDQFRYATIQSVIAQFCARHDLPSAVPLGRFYPESKNSDERRPLTLCPPYPKELFGELAFTEVYWAEIPRKIVNDEHTLEDARLWARTIVERLQLRGGVELKKLEAEIDAEILALEKERKKLLAEGNQGEAARRAYRREGKEHLKNACSASKLEESDYSMVKQVLYEMIQTIAVLERLCHLADRAGLFSFDLGKLLDNYLGDVQIVTEFRAQRGMILDEFRCVMKAAHEFDHEAEIHIVAHSEGTVVSFLGLLEALSDDCPPGWVKRVRGLMTLGSPIDKHLILWPEELWRKFENPDPNAPPNPKIQYSPTKPSQRIKWYNYYDKGDPVGYELNEAREWLSSHNWDQVFDFPKENDIGFWRYPLPGKAHVDYWKDEEVFGHFIEKVVLPETAGDQNNDAESGFSESPSKWWAPLVSYVASYLGVGALLFAAVFILSKALQTCLDPGGRNTAALSKWGFFGNALGATCLLYGVTVTARIPRLTGIWYWRSLGPLFYAVSAVIFLWTMNVSHMAPGAPMSALRGWLIERFNIEALGGVTRAALATALILVVWAMSRWRKSQSYGLKPLLGLGFVLVATIVVSQVYLDPDSKHGPLWPLALATVGFLCLWSLAALIFDLVFVWHLYIHSSNALRRIGGIVASPYARKEWEQARAGKPKRRFKLRLAEIYDRVEFPEEEEEPDDE